MQRNKWLLYRESYDIIQPLFFSNHNLVSSRRFEKTDDIVHYRSGPRVSSGYVNSSDSSTRASPDKQHKHNRQRNNGSINSRSSSIAHTIANDSVIAENNSNNKKAASISKSDSLISNNNSSTSFTTYSKQQSSEDFENFGNNLYEGEKENSRAIAATILNRSNNNKNNNKMAPNNSGGNGAVTQQHQEDAGSAIISGHKIALNVHYDQQNGHGENYLNRSSQSSESKSTNDWWQSYLIFISRYLNVLIQYDIIHYFNHNAIRLQI